MSRTRLILLAAWLGAFLAGFDFAALYVAIPVISDEFNIGLSATSWIVVAYTLVFVGFTISVGTLAQRFGMRAMLATGFAVFGLLSIPCALATDIYTLTIARAVQALGGSMLYVLGPAVVRTMIPEEDQERAFGLFTFAPYVGISLGPALGGLLIYYLGWPWIFYVNLPFCLLGLYAASALPPRRQGSDGEAAPALDIGGALLGFAFLAFLTVALNQGREWGWMSVPILGCLVGFAVTFGLFLWWERDFSESAINLGLFGNRVFTLCAASLAVLLAVGAGAQFLFPIHLQWYLGISVRDAGFALMAMAGGLAVTTMQAERLAGMLPVRDLCLAGLVVCAAGAVVFAVGGQQTPVWAFIAGMAILGMGMGMLYPHTMRLAMQSVPDDQSIRASTALSSIRSTAQLLGIVTFETIFSQIYVNPVRPYYGSPTDSTSAMRMSDAFHVSFAIAVVLLLAALTPLLFLKRAGKESDDT